MKITSVFLTVALLAVLGGAVFNANATSYNYVVTPDDLIGDPDGGGSTGAGFNNGYSDYMFGYDPSTDGNAFKPLGVDTPDGASGLGNGSFWSDDIAAGSSGSGTHGDYTTLRLNPRAIFGLTSTASFTLDDLDNLSFDTQGPTGTGEASWFVKIYTRDANQDSSPWYRNSWNFGGAVNTASWTTYQLVGGNELDVTRHDAKTDTGQTAVTEYPGSYPDFSSLLTPYGSEEILFIDIAASYWSWGVDTNSYLDNIVLTRANGDIATLDLGVPVPEPATMTLLGLGLGGMVLSRIRRRIN